jgi:GNAT superfamily N-acetyltransferase
MKIKKAELIDLPLILELQKLCFLENAQRYNNYQIPQLVQTIDELQADYKKWLIFKYEDNGKIIGSIRAYEENNICYIGRLMVHPDSQNRGIGGKIMSDIEGWFPEVNRFELFTGDKDHKNINFYSKIGYKQFKEESLEDNVKFIYFEKGIGKLDKVS